VGYYHRIVIANDRVSHPKQSVGAWKKDGLSAILGTIEIRTPLDARYARQLLAQKRSPAWKRQMRRREFIMLVGDAVAAWPFAAALAEQPLPHVGFLLPRTPASHGGYVVTFLRGLDEAGLVKDQNFALDLRYAEEHPDRIPALVRELVDKRVDVLAVGGPAAAVAAKAATATIPIVFVASSPIDLGLVASLNRPGGNVTGVDLFGATVEPKKLELLHQLVPKALVIGVLVNPSSPTTEIVSKEVEATAQTPGLPLHILKAAQEASMRGAAQGILSRSLGTSAPGDVAWPG
jgi:putative ABC transport system substrate-binding protein